MADIDVGKVYEEYRTDLIRLAKSYASRYGGEPEELIADGGLLLVRAVQTFDPAKGSLRKRIVHALWNGWKDIDRKKRRKREEGGKAALEALQTAQDRGKGLDELDDDADRVLRLVADPPPDVRMTALVIHDEMRPVSLRLAIMEYLKDIGWAVERIEESFREIRESL